LGGNDDPDGDGAAQAEEPYDDRNWQPGIDLKPRDLRSPLGDYALLVSLMKLRRAIRPVV
jgi:hypothetical protein